MSGTVYSNISELNEYLKSPSLISDTDITITPTSSRIVLSRNVFLHQNTDEFFDNKVYIAAYQTKTQTNKPVEVFSEELTVFSSNYVYYFNLNFITPNADASVLLSCCISILATDSGNVIVGDPFNVQKSAINDRDLENVSCFMEWDGRTLTFFVIGIAAYESLKCGTTYSVQRITTGK
jgi:hypothetical protein